MESSASLGSSYFEGVSCGRWVAGSVATVIAVCAVVFAILGGIQPDWFTHAVGTVGNPHSWPLWTIFGGGLLVSGALMAYALLSKSGKMVTVDFSLLESEPDFVKKSLHAKTTLPELFAGDAKLLEETPQYAGALRQNFEVDPTLVTESVLTGLIEGGNIPFILFRLKCVSPDEKIGSCLDITPITQLTGKNAEEMASLNTQIMEIKIREAKEKPTLLIFWRNKDRWMQRWDKYDMAYSNLLMPSFLSDSSTGRPLIGQRFGSENSGGIVDEKHIQLEEQGFANLKNLMRGEKVADHNGLEWELVTS